MDDEISVGRQKCMDYEYGIKKIEAEHPLSDILQGKLKRCLEVCWGQSKINLTV